LRKLVYLIMPSDSYSRFSQNKNPEIWCGLVWLSSYKQTLNGMHGSHHWEKRRLKDDTVLCGLLRQFFEIFMRTFRFPTKWTVQLPITALTFLMFSEILRVQQPKIKIICLEDPMPMDMKKMSLMTNKTIRKMWFLL
jgi:hypothetical protein